MSAVDREHAEALDAADPLAQFRERFVYAGDPETIYLDGNSLGRLPLAGRDQLHRLIEQWGGQLVAGWDEWIDLPARVGDQLGAAALGAAPGQVLVCDSTTVNLYKLASAALDALSPPGATTIVTDAGNFPTDRYVLEGLAERRGMTLRMIDADEVEGPTVADVEAACAGGDVAFIVLSHVGYRSAAVADLAEITRTVRVPVLWDLSHSVGALPISLDGDGVQLAVGCTYKYLNGGPGAPAFLYVRRDLQERLRSPIQGWFGQHDQFAMQRPYDPRRDIRRFLAGTPPILQLVGVAAAVELLAEIGLDRIRAKSMALTSLAVALHDEWLAPLGFGLASPRDPNRRGSHVCLRHPNAESITEELITKQKVIADFRGPDRLRLGLAAPYTTFVEVYDAMARLRSVATPA
jgi:kynureninase